MLLTNRFVCLSFKINLLVVGGYHFNVLINYSRRKIKLKDLLYTLVKCIFSEHIMFMVHFNLYLTQM